MKAVITKVSIDGNPVSFTGVNLVQEINKHHHFNIIIDLEAAEAIDAYEPTSSKAWIGKNISISFDSQTFYGVVTSVALKRSGGSNGSIHISGFSSTYKLENGAHLRSWCDKGLATIVNDAIGSSGVTADVKPEYTSTPSYECQYMESNFQFIRRLAKQYGEWLYYDGEKLKFGKPGSLPTPIKLIYGYDLQQLDLNMNITARPSKGFSYNAAGNDNLDSSSPNSSGGLGDLGQTAFNATMSLFPEGAVHFIAPRVGNRFELGEVLKKEQQAQASQSYVVSGSSYNSNVKIGGVVDLRTSLIGGGIDPVPVEKNLGLYFITSIVHQAGEGDSYENSFEGIPSSVPSLPAPDAEYPIAQTQSAVVVDNKDPKNQGRVRVKMNWQGSEKTQWLRVMTPNAGKSDKVPKNRGLVFVPEVDDIVLVGFRHDNPNRPFVLGSLFNGTTASGGSDNNKTKSITTRSGSTITFD
ncbi:MAG: phage baseplate assembly protein V, partial [Bacteroidales bacterium]